MPRITYITSEGSTVVTADVGDTLMETAVEHGIPGIEGNCGGVCSCATCHVRIGPEWADRVGPPDSTERDMLEFVENAGAGSRLSCQIGLTDAHDGLVVEVVAP